MIKLFPSIVCRVLDHLADVQLAWVDRSFEQSVWSDALEVCVAANMVTGTMATVPLWPQGNAAHPPLSPMDVMGRRYGTTQPAPVTLRVPIPRCLVDTVHSVCKCVLFTRMAVEQLDFGALRRSPGRDGHCASSGEDDAEHWSASSATDVFDSCVTRLVVVSCSTIKHFIERMLMSFVADVGVSLHAANEHFCIQVSHALDARIAAAVAAATAEAAAEAAATSATAAADMDVDGVAASDSANSVGYIDSTSWLKSRQGATSILPTQTPDENALGNSVSFTSSQYSPTKTSPARVVWRTPSRTHLGGAGATIGLENVGGGGVENLHGSPRRRVGAGTAAENASTRGLANSPLARSPNKRGGTASPARGTPFASASSAPTVRVDVTTKSITVSASASESGDGDFNASDGADSVEEDGKRSGRNSNDGGDVGRSVGDGGSGDGRGDGDDDDDGDEISLSLASPIFGLASVVGQSPSHDHRGTNARPPRHSPHPSSQRPPPTRPHQHPALTPSASHASGGATQTVPRPGGAQSHVQLDLPFPFDELDMGRGGRAGGGSTSPER